METLSPEVLARLCRETLPEDTRPFEALVARCKDRVYATAYRLLGDRHAAEDQAQEVFVKVYRGIGDLDDPEMVMAWIYRLTLNSCFDTLRKRQRTLGRSPSISLSMEDNGDIEVSDLSTATPEATALRRELHECIEETLQRMSVRDRAILILRDIEGRPYNEIADAVSAGLGAIKMRIHRARLAFQRLFEQLCPDLWKPSSAGEDVQ